MLVKFRPLILLLFLSEIAILLYRFYSASSTPKVSQIANITRVILDWTGYFSTILEEFWDNRTLPLDCVITKDRSLEARADAVIFGATIDWNDLPSKRREHQRYVFYQVESPIEAIETGSLKKAPKNFFNWTLTYRADSDFPAPYGAFESSRDTASPLELTLSEREQLKRKNRTAAWFVSKCPSDSRRENLVKMLAENGLEIDVYTKSADCRDILSGQKNIHFLKCGSQQRTTYRDRECLSLLNFHYYFYLAFENSVCNDYVTEKLFDRILYANVVPVILSRRAAIRTIGKLPGKAVIAADDFTSVKEMVSVLVSLRNDYKDYRSHLQWRDDFRISPSDYGDAFLRAVARLCVALDHAKLKQSQVENIEDWWIRKADCQRQFVDRTVFQQEND